MRRVILAAALALGSLAACGGDDNASDDADRKLSVITTVLPVAETAARVGGDLVSVRNLTPAGAEPHDVELTADDIDDIEDADVVFYIGGGFQPAVEKALRGRKTGGAVDVTRDMDLEGDPHFWLDPELMSQLLGTVSASLADVAPEHADAFRDNDEKYGSELDTLFHEYDGVIPTCARKDLVTAHAAFGHLASAFGLQQHALTGLSPESEADPKRVADLADLVRDRGVTTIFYEELVPRDFADALAREAGVKTAVLNPLEGLTKAEQNDGETYVSIMRKNLTTLRSALGCQQP